MRISVFGLGYVGAVSASCLARDGHEVVGCDIDPIKLDLFRRGQSPIIEEGMAELVEAAVASGRLTVTDRAAEAVAASTLSLICVGTPSDRAGGQDLTAIRRLCTQLGEALAHKISGGPDAATRGPGQPAGGSAPESSAADKAAPVHGFVVRSTVAPGTTEQVVIPLLEAGSGKKEGEDFAVAFQPEFLREGSSIRDYDRPPYTIVGTRHPTLEADLRTLYGDLPAPVLATDIRSAEMLKMVANAFHALKITFANEVGRLGQSMGVDPREVMRLICEDHQLNISAAYLRPGFAFGGSCLPKDVRALEALARQSAVPLPVLQGILPSNQQQIDHAMTTILETGARNIGLLGLSFKSGTDDLRESPLVALAERCIGKGLALQIYDPEVQLARLIGANKRYLEQSLPHVASLMQADPEAVVKDAELIIVGRAGDDVLQALRRTRADQRVLDLVGLPQDASIPASIAGLCW